MADPKPQPAMPKLLESSADGDFGKKSVTALQKFLNQEGFPCRSVCCCADVCVTFVVLSRHRLLEQVIHAVSSQPVQGFYCGTEDGDWGGTTEKALQLFLKDAGYDVDFKKDVRDGGRNTELFQEFLQDEDQDCKPDGAWGKKSAMALQNFLKNEDASEFATLYKGSPDCL